MDNTTSVSPSVRQLKQTVRELEALLDISNRQKIRAASLLMAALSSAGRIINDPAVPAQIVADMSRFHSHVAGAVASLTSLEGECLSETVFGSGIYPLH